ncbi:hypothetical protein, partial [Enterobacter hormaechei]|uniref:hypothetical protein n=1 Tax=Enterobacter hormaechei TaxID=158836 RepID=UPI0019531AA4
RPGHVARAQHVVFRLAVAYSPPPLLLWRAQKSRRNFPKSRRNWKQSLTLAVLGVTGHQNTQQPPAHAGGCFRFMITTMES